MQHSGCRSCAHWIQYKRSAHHVQETSSFSFLLHIQLQFLFSLTISGVAVHSSFCVRKLYLAMNMRTKVYKYDHRLHFENPEPSETGAHVTVHGVLLPRQQFDESPEGVLFIHVDQQQSCDLTHALAVAHLLQTHINQLRGNNNGAILCFTFVNLA